MIREHLPGLPEITIQEWQGLAIPQQELRAVLAYLAYKTGKAVHLKGPSHRLHYSMNAVMVYPCPPNAHLRAQDTLCLRLDGQEYPLDPRQGLYDGSDADGKCISDENELALAAVDHNCIVLHIALLNADNDTARLGLSRIVEQAIPLLDFDVTAIVQGEFEAMKAQLSTFLSAVVSARLEDKRSELQSAEREAEDAYYIIVEAERKKPLLAAEIEALERLSKRSGDGLVTQQATALQELKAGCLYEDIKCQPDGAVSAITGQIVINHNGWEFPLGCYQVDMDRRGELKIRNLESHERADYPHPHVATDFRPCLGNITADLGRMIGKMRIAEALQVVHQFLCSYNPENPYESIGHFDPTGQYYEADEDPCHECDDKCSPYCICDCPHNDGQYTCSDCYEYRSDFCFQQCELNRDYESVHPCDGCNNKGSGYCYRECPYNESWQLQNPCSDCDLEECDENCPYKNRKEELDHAESPVAEAV